ncbi:hypothetical protein HYO62_02820 [Aerococcaceae bacterium DSM 111022]|nr:hypothetical protein [Aerococcaceae bacterium DSM 111022]
MEIPFNNAPFQNTINKLSKLSNSFIDAFILPDFASQQETSIMPQHQVEHILHDHYVSTKPLAITFEHYDANDKLRSDEIIAVVTSPIQLNQTIALQPMNSKYSIYLPIDQILSVASAGE